MTSKLVIISIAIFTDVLNSVKRKRVSFLFITFAKYLMRTSQSVLSKNLTKEGTKGEQQPLSYYSKRDKIGVGNKQGTKTFFKYEISAYHPNNK